MVPMEGVEPTHSCEYQILSLARLPIPPHRLPNNQKVAILNANKQRCLVKRKASPSNSAGSKSRSRRHSYHKVLDNRKHPIHGLWRRNGKFLARITVEAEDGRRSVHWVKLAAKSAAET